MVFVTGLESSIRKGEELLTELSELQGCRGRRSDDLQRPEMLEVRDFLRPFFTWDTQNKALIAELFSAESEQLARYLGVGQPDFQKALTDFISSKAQIQHALLEKLEILRVFQRGEYEASVLFRKTNQKPCVFIGHGRSPQWRELKDYVYETLGLAYEEFNRAPVAGLAITERIDQMLDRCTFALLVMTGEDEHADGSLHARENVIHEAGLFQGRLGYRRALLVCEEGCAAFSNNSGIIHVRYARGSIKSAFEEIRRALEREDQILPSPAAQRRIG